MGAKYYNVNHRHRPLARDVSAAPSHRMPQGTLVHRSLHSPVDVDILVLGREKGPGGPNLRGGGNRA